jgi:hypothetical protein
MYYQGTELCRQLRVDDPASQERVAHFLLPENKQECPGGPGLDLLKITIW